MPGTEPWSRVGANLFYAPWLLWPLVYNVVVVHHVLGDRRVEHMGLLLRVAVARREWYLSAAVVAVNVLSMWALPLIVRTPPSALADPATSRLLFLSAVLFEPPAVAVTLLWWYHLRDRCSPLTQADIAAEQGRPKPEITRDLAHDAT
jgi:hypothetical protein